jgi:hypothetical protein
VNSPSHADIWGGGSNPPKCLACRRRPSAVFTSLREQAPDVPSTFYLCEACYTSFVESVLAWPAERVGETTVLVISHPSDDWLDAFARAADDSE